MANILEYLEWRGDLPLSSVPFNEVDAAILARLSYLPLEAVLENQGGTKQSGKAKELTVAQAMEALQRRMRSSCGFCGMKTRS